MRPNPPKFFLQFFKWFCHPDLRQPIEGDLMELYEQREIEHGLKKANRKFILDVLLLLRTDITKPVGGTYRLNIYGMIKSYLKSTMRVLLKNKLITLASFLSLIVGALCFQIIFAWLQNEISTDRFHKNIDNIYVSLVKANPQADFKPMGLKTFFNFDYNQFAHVKSSLTVHMYNNGQMHLISDHAEFSVKGLVADSTFFDFFDFPLLYGNVNGTEALKDPTTILITENYALKIFGNQDPIGKIIAIETGNSNTYQIGGVLKNIPSNSSLTFDILIPKHSRKFWSRSPQEFFLTDDFFDILAYNEEIKELGREHIQFKESVLSSVPLNTVYFENHYGHSLFSRYGDMKYVKIMAAIALFIILISTLSFGNLQTTLQLSSLQSMGIKRVNGASKFDLSVEMIIGRFYFLIITIIGTCVAFEILFPFFTAILDTRIDRNMLDNITIISMVTTAIILTSILISIFQITKIEVLKSLRNKLVTFNVARLQRSLTTFPFTFTIILIISTVIVFQQFFFMLNKDLGLNAESVISFKPLVTEVSRNLEDQERARLVEEENNKYHFFINQLNENPDILEVSQGEMPVNSVAYPMPWKPLDSETSYTSENIMIVDPGYMQLLGLKMKEGRFFADSIDGSRAQQVVINEAALKYWGIENIDQIRLANNYWGAEEDPFTIIGVVKDFHYEHLSKKVNPLIMLYMHDNENNFLVKMRKDTEQKTLAFVRDLYYQINPDRQFEYVFLNSEIEAQYKSEKRLSKVYMIFTIVALILSAIGLYTFAIHETRRRTKEIGIRKINGASIKNIFKTLGQTFLRPILIAYLIACPISWYFAQKWLEDFANRIDINPVVFIFAGLLTISIAFLAVSWQSWVAARKNPIDALRYE